MADSVKLPPIPNKTPFLDRNGFMSHQWDSWFRDVFIRIGGTSALSNKDLEAIQGEELEVIEEQIILIAAQIAGLNIVVPAHTTQIQNINTKINDILQGPNL